MSLHLLPDIKDTLPAPEREDFISSYLSYAKISTPEVPTNYHRWAILTSLGAYLGRQFYLPHGLFPLIPNIYCMLIGSAGTRKGTAIKAARALLEKADYDTFAAERTSKEKFLLDLSGETGNEGNGVSLESFLQDNVFGTAGGDREMFIAIDEFNDFIGNGNIEFISMLGNMWNYHGLYRNRIKTGKSVEIQNPTISIIGGNTPVGFSLAFPPEILSQGFFSRLMLIYGEPNGLRVTFPESPNESTTADIVRFLRDIKTECSGPAHLSSSAKILLDRIYQSYTGLADTRFESYSNRRFDHLLKLCIICTAARVSVEIGERDVIYANTILTHAEHFMPRALGEFGKSKHADVAHRVMELVNNAEGVITSKELWRHVHADLEKPSDLGMILSNLVAADKIQNVIGVPKPGFLPKKRVSDYGKSIVDFSLLTIEEQRMIKP